jgi:hypothetical protein
MTRPFVLVGCLAAAVMVVAILYTLAESESPGKSPGSGNEAADGLLATNRDRLRICVDDVDAGVSESEAKARVEIAMIEVRENASRWEKFGFGAHDPRVDAGCPSPPLLLQPGVEAFDRGPGRGLETSQRRVVDEPSQYRVFLFVVPGEVLDSFGAAPQYLTE